MSESNNRILEALSVLSDPDDCQVVPFVGAGASFILGHPSWTQLVYDYHKECGCKLDIEVLAAEHNKNWPIVADKIFEDTQRDFEKYYGFMSKMSPKDIPYQPLHVSLLSCFDKIITTNYDLAFEAAIRKIKIWKKLNTLFFPGNLNPIDFQKNSIAYIHGHVNKKAFVFRNEEYETAYNSSTEITDFLRSVIKKNSLLFVGFSFEDKTFKERLRELILKAKEQARTIHDVFGMDYRDDVVKTCYVIMSSRELEVDLLKSKLQALEVKNDVILEYFQENAEGILTLRAGKTIDKEVRERHEKLFWEFQRISSNKEKVNYFETLKFEVIPYNPSNRIEIINFIDSIENKRNGFEDTLPEL